MQQHPFTIDQVRTFWDNVADEYDRVNRTMGWTHTERFTTMQLFLSTSAKTIINVWSRTGSAVPFIRKLCPRADLVNLEVSGRLRKIAQERYPQENFRDTDLHDLPFETESQDVVVSLETLEHVPDPLHFLLEVHRVLAVGGRLILSAPPAWCEPLLRLYERFFENHGEGPHKFPAVRTTLRALRQCDFQIIEHRGTVLLPVGPPMFKKIAEWLQLHILRYIGTNRLGIRHFYIAEKRRSRDPVWAKIQEEILRPGLSTHSGTCVGLSEGTLRLQDIDGECFPALTGKGPVPAICYRASPEVHPSYPEMNDCVFGSPTPRSSLLGEYRRLAIAHINDEAVRHAAASGGVLTGVLLYLLETERITGAVVLTMDAQHPWRAIPIVARTPEEILQAAQSKYVVSPVNTILNGLEKHKGPLAYVGLPHQVFAIRRLQQLKHPSVQAIDYILGPFYGNEMYGSALVSFLRKFHAQPKDVVSLAYRAGEWPGYMEARLHDGRILRMPKFHANYLIPFHISQSSLLSHDLTNEFTDLSGGDAWAPVYEERGKGFSLLITRTQKGDDLLREMEEKGKIHLKEIDEEEAVQMQSHGLDFKKRGTFLRMERRRRCGQRILDYGLMSPSIGVSRRMFEGILDSLFALCALPISRWCIDRTPEWIIGPVFIKARTLWKKLTRNVKRGGLADAQ
ncbi:MAG: coenzyme F420 hydrogenase/dehydrogenase beta subunit N-terminal domain-containing protein [Candidatus Peribacteraceae bacterium]